MNLFSPPLVLLLEREQLSLTLPKSTIPLVLSFPKDMVLAQEIKDPTKFNQLLQEFLTANNAVKKEFTIILGQDLLFQNTAGEPDDKFLSEVPFAPSSVISQKVMISGNSILVATNKDFYLAVKEAIESGGGKVKAVVPFDTKPIASSKIKLPVLGFLALVAGIGLVSLVYLVRAPKPSPTPISPLAPTVSPKPGTPSAQIKSKTELKIMVLNGTGGEGDAKKVKDELLALEYQNIEVGNLDVQNATASSLIYFTDANTYLAEITTVLQKLFKLEPIITATTSSSFDLQVITGKH